MEFLSPETLRQVVPVAFPPVLRPGREAASTPPGLVEVFERLEDGEYAVVGVQPKYGDKRDLSALAAVGALNRSATREGLRARGCLFILRSQADGDTGNTSIHLYIGRDTERVSTLDAKAAAKKA